MLIDLKTDLTSLKFGKDRPNGGSSDEPYIKSKIDNTIVLQGDNGLVRGGALGVAKASAIDTLRIGKFLTDLPRGPLFILKQVGLQLSNPKLESRVIAPINLGGGTTKIGRIINSGKVILNKGIDILNNNSIGPTRIYAGGINTLKQVPLAGLGGHIVRHGFNTRVQPEDTYEYIVRANNESGSNRLVLLYDKIVNKGELVISSYIGGPGSTYGVGFTTISRDTDSNSKIVENPNFNILESVQGRARTKFSKGKIAYSNGLPKLDANGKEIGGTNQVITIKNDWSAMNRETRIGSGRADAINLTPLFNSNTPPGTSVKIGGVEHNVRDLIKFRIEAINPLNYLNSDWMVFRAYLPNGFRDSFQAEWNEVKYQGLAEKVGIQTGFNRAFSISFKVAALSSGEMKPMYQKLNYLASNVMPSYVGDKQLMNSSLIKLTVGNYLYRQTGWISAIEYSVTNETPWEIAIDDPEAGDGQEMYELPHIIDVSMTFRPIHDFLAQKSPSNPLIIDKERTKTATSHWLREDDKITPLRIHGIDKTKNKKTK